MPGALVTAIGTLNESALPAPDATCTTTVAAFIGPAGVGQSSLINALLGSNLPVSDGHTTLGINMAEHGGDASVLQAGPPRRIVALDVEGSGGDHAREEARELISTLALALADALILTVRMKDLVRRESNGVGALRRGLTELLRFRETGVVSGSGKRLFIVVVTDFEEEVLPREEMINGMLKEMQAVYDTVVKSARAPVRMADLYDFEFVTLPSKVWQEDAFGEAVEAFRESLIDPFCDDYLFGGAQSYGRESGEGALGDVATKVWRALQEEETRDLPEERELTASFECNSTMYKVWEKFRRGTQHWSTDVEEGNVIENFGSASAELLTNTLAVYDQDAAPYRTSSAFGRKRAELKDKLERHLYDLFTQQTQKLREVSYGSFKEKLEEISSDGPGFEKSINKALRDAQNYFATEAEKLRSKSSSWRFDNETKELASHMREDATDCLQRARLAEYGPGGRNRRGARRGGRGGRPAGASQRKPISISFHYLDPAPFGFKDSRYEKLSTDDNLRYDPASALAEESDARPPAGLPILPGRNDEWDRDYIYTDKPGSGGR